MRRFALTLLALSFIAAPLSAWLRPCSGQWGLEGEWLYFQPAVDSPYFVIEGTDTASPPVGPRRANSFNHHSGYRLEGAYTFCNGCNDVRLRWSSLNVKDSKTVSGAFLWPTLASPTGKFPAFLAYSGKASSISRLRWHAAELLFGQFFFCNGPFDFSLEGGVQYAYLNFQQNARYSPSASTLRPVYQTQDKFWGWDPKLAQILVMTFAEE